MIINILIPNFEDLGAQRVAINIANSLSEEYDITFVVIEDKGPFRSYLNKNINIIDLSQISMNFPKLRVLTKAISYAKYVKKYNVNLAISFSPITNFYILLAKFMNKNLRTIIQEHAYPSVALKDRGNASWIYEQLFSKVFVHFYNKSDIFLTIADAIKDDFINNFGMRNDFFKIVRNPLDIENIINMAGENIDDFNFDNNKKYLISVGRLSYQKNFSRLINIFNIVQKNVKNVELIILGKGNLEGYLSNFAEQLGLINKIHLLGFKSNPYKYISKADIFCLTSDWEGLPQVLAEAMICKTLVISHKCKSGPEEMIADKTSGVLVEYNDIDCFAKEVRYYLENIEFSKVLIENAFNFACNEYSNKNAQNKYIDIIKELK